MTNITLPTLIIALILLLSCQHFNKSLLPVYLEDHFDHATPNTNQLFHASFRLLYHRFEIFNDSRHPTQHSLVTSYFTITNLSNEAPTQQSPYKVSKVPMSGIKIKLPNLKMAGKAVQWSAPLDSDDSDFEPFGQSPSTSPQKYAVAPAAKPAASPAKKGKETVSENQKSNHAQARSSKEDLLKENEDLRKQLEAFGAVTTKNLDKRDCKGRTVDQLPQELQRFFDRAKNKALPVVMFNQVIQQFSNVPTQNHVGSHKLGAFLTLSEHNSKALAKGLFPLRKVINRNDFSPSAELQKQIARVTCSDVYSLERLRKVERLIPRYPGESDYITTAVAMSIILEMVFEDPFPATDIDHIFQILMDEKTKPEILSE